MKLDEFDYQLPPDRIAQRPLPERDGSRLLALRRKDQSREEAGFRDLPRFLDPGDLLVVNDTRVQPFRLLGEKPTGGRVELTLTGRGPDQTWECLLRTHNPKPGLKVLLPGKLRAELLGVSESQVRVSPTEGAPLWRVRFSGEEVASVLSREGLPPLPPYLRREEGDDPAEDQARYQTVYAGDGEAAAAPTAGLHFTPELLQELAQKKIALARVRLDVSYGTFAPVRAPEIEDHVMHPEHFEISEAVVQAVRAAQARGSKVIAVGTTVVRVLEQASLWALSSGAHETSLFIYPGYKFRAVDALITNFHLPRSTLLMLVAAFAGREFVLDSYRDALDRGFRFLSYGDAMLIL